MAQYFHDFADGITGWTQRTLTTGHTAPAWSVVSTDQLQATSTANRNEMLAWDSIDADADRDDVEVLVQVKVSSTARHWIAVRIVGSGSTDGYVLALGTTEMQFRRIEGGAFLTLATASVSFSADDWVNLRFRINGTAAYGRAWADGDSEPGTWDIDGTAATAYTAAGYVGPAKHSDTSTQLWRYFGVGTNGDSAPASAGGGLDSSVSESGGAVETASSVMAAAAAAAESAAATAGQTAALSAAASTSESATGTSAQSAALVAAADAVETAAATDTSASTLAAAVAVSEAASATDTTAGNLSGTYSASLADSDPAADTVSALLAAVAAASESAAAADVCTAVKQGAYAAVLAEVAPVLDACSRSILMAATLAESAAAVDAVSAALQGVAQPLSASPAGRRLQLAGRPANLQTARRPTYRGGTR
jgi:hypothetical protein